MWDKVFNRMDQVKFVEDSVLKIYLIHSWILFLKYTLREHLDIIAYGSVTVLRFYLYCHNLECNTKIFAFSTI